LQWPWRCAASLPPDSPRGGRRWPCLAAPPRCIRLLIGIVRDSWKRGSALR
jgi:hypothetical protein